MTKSLPHELQLTALISTLLNWVEQQHPRVLYYGQVNLRRAVECYFYFETIVQPTKLAPLLSVAKDWRLENEGSKQSETYDYYYTAARKRSFFRALSDRVVPWFRILKDYSQHLKSRFCFGQGNKKADTNQKKIGFFAINKRFVHFFEELEPNFNQETNVFFSLNAGMMPTCSTNQNIFARAEKFSISFRSFSVFPRHALFPVYFRLCFFYQRIAATLQHWKPDVLLFAEGTSHYDELAAQAARDLNIPTVRLQSGRAGILHSGYQDMSFDVMVCWGMGFVERYKTTSQRPKYIVCGSSLVDGMRDFRPAKIDIKKTLVIFTQPISRHVSKADYMSLVQIAKSVANRAGDVNIVVRMHPIDKSEEFHKLANHFRHKVRIMNSPDFLLADVMRISQCALGLFSTTLSEAAACGVVPIILKLSDAHSVFPFPEKHGAAIVVESLPAALNKINNVMSHPEDFSELKDNMKRFSSHFFGEQNGDSVRRIVDEVRSVARMGVIHGSHP